MGEEGEQDPTLKEAPPKAQPPKPKKKKKKPPPPPEAEDRDAQALEAETKQNSDEESAPARPSRGSFYFGGGLGSSSGEVSAQLTLGYNFNRYIGAETTYFYDQLSQSTYSGVQQGPEFDLILKAANPTIFTPFVGFGPGYSKWQRKESGVVFDDSSSVTANVFFGLDVRLTNHFGIQVIRKDRVYVGTPPLSYGDSSMHDGKSTWTTDIGFRVAF